MPYVAAHARGTGLLHYLVGPPVGDRDRRVRVLGAADRPLLDALQTSAGAAATEEAEVDVEHRAVVGDIAGRAARADRLVQYRCNRENEAPARLARACGFTLWGVLTVAAQPD